MSDKVKNIINTICFILIIIGIGIINILSKDVIVSEAERRKLQQFPKISFESFEDGKFSNDFENYAMDQFMQRQFFRSIKTYMQLSVFRQKDNNQLYIDNGSIVKIDKTNFASVENSIKKINNIYEKYLKGMNVYYTIIPDKYYYSKNSSNTRNDYEKMVELYSTNLNNMKYINIFDCLEINDYFNTDTHWKQENLSKVVDRISTNMKFNEYLKTPYKKQTITDFYGVYYGQLAYNMKPDNIICLNNDIIENSTVYNYETNKTTKVYDFEKLNSSDKYDIYLSGASPLLTITNDNCQRNKELIVFRDSFASSIIPLFIEAYNKITVIDTRYMSTDQIKDYVKFNNQDVIFMYSTLIINNSYSLK